MNKLKLMEFVGVDSAIGWVINNLQDKMDIFHKKNPDVDIKQQKSIIGILSAYRETTLELHQTEKVMTKKYLEEHQKVLLLTKINNDNAIIIKNLKTGL